MIRLATFSFGHGLLKIFIYYSRDAGRRFRLISFTVRDGRRAYIGTHIIALRRDSRYYDFDDYMKPRRRDRLAIFGIGHYRGQASLQMRCAERRRDIYSRCQFHFGHHGKPH